MRCVYCKSKEIVKRGLRYNHHGKKQKYQCLKCERWFVDDDGFKHMRHTKEDIVRAVHLHVAGLSLYKTMDLLWQHDGIKVTKRTISQWTKRYSTFLKSDTFERATNAQRKAAL